MSNVNFVIFDLAEGRAKPTEELPKQELVKIIQAAYDRIAQLEDELFEWRDNKPLTD